MSRIPQPETDWHRLLGVRTEASAEEVQRAFRRQAMLHHPDRNRGDKAAEERFKEILNAYKRAIREVEQRAGQSSSRADPPKAHRTGLHDTFDPRSNHRSRNLVARYLKFVILFVVASIILIQVAFIALTFIWFNTKTDWIPSCC